MQQAHPAKLLRIHISESDRHSGKPLYEAIVDKCRAMKIAGATVFRGLEGYGETAELHRHHLTRQDQPIVITIVDSPENLALLAPVVEDMMDTGLLAVSEVEVIRVQKKVMAPDGKAG
jgi:PII-like signaling protein